MITWYTGDLCRPTCMRTARAFNHEKTSRLVDLPNVHVSRCSGKVHLIVNALEVRWLQIAKVPVLQPRVTTSQAGLGPAVRQQSHFPFSFPFSYSPFLFPFLWLWACDSTASSIHSTPELYHSSSLPTQRTINNTGWTKELVPHQENPLFGTFHARFSRNALTWSDKVSLVLFCTLSCCLGTFVRFYPACMQI